MDDRLFFDQYTLIKKIDDIKIKIALLSYMDIEGKLLIEENKTLQNDEFYCLDKKTKRQIKKNIRKLYSNIRFGSALHASLRVLNKAAAILLFVIILLSISIFHVEAIRTKLFNFIIDMQDEYTSISINPNDNVSSNSIDINWSNAYAPTLIPEGYVSNHIVELKILF